jgi:hypothetical protein
LPSARFEYVVENARTFDLGIIRFDGLIRQGNVTNLAELAALGHVTRARVTQIMNLLNLAPDIQEDLLFRVPPESGRETITEKSLRPITAEAEWRKQRRMWGECRPSNCTTERYPTDP